MTRGSAALWLALLTSPALWMAPGDAFAQSHPRALLEDTGDFRAALGSAAANVTMTAGEDTVNGRIAQQPRGFRWIAGRNGAWAADDDALAFPLRMAAAIFATDDVTDAVAALGFRLDETLLTVDVMATAEGDMLVSRLGGSHASVAIEHDIARLREIRIHYGNVEYIARALAYDGPGNGWFPSRVVVLEDGVEVLQISVGDVARETSNLAAMDTVGQATTAPAAATNTLRFPRMPL